MRIAPVARGDLENPGESGPVSSTGVAYPIGAARANPSREATCGTNPLPLALALTSSWECFGSTAPAASYRLADLFPGSPDQPLPYPVREADSGQFRRLAEQFGVLGQQADIEHGGMATRRCWLLVHAAIV